MNMLLGNVAGPRQTKAYQAQPPVFGSKMRAGLRQNTGNHLPSGLASLSYVAPQIRFGRRPASVDAFQYWLQEEKNIPSLKPFQEMAVEHLAKNRSVVVATPTSSGKTLVAEYAVWDALYNPDIKRPKRVFYTTPRKALSNEKYEDFLRQYDPKGEGKVGLMTGDVTINHDAPVVIMTTEVLRNMLYDKEANAETLKDLNYIVLDECHFIDEPYRGMVWEETIVNAPKSSQIIHLSATVRNADEYARWLNSIHNIKTELVELDERPVPLTKYMLTGGKNPQLVRIFENDGTTQTQQFKKQFKTGLKNPERFDPVHAVAHEFRSGKLPGIFFRFSRKGCEEYAMQTAKYQGFHTGDEDSTGYLVNPAERFEINRVIVGFLNDSPWLKHSRLLEPLSEDMADNMLTRGVAPHHGGMLPVERKMVEVLLRKGLLKAVFATDTLAAGMNVPAQSVTLTEYERFIDGFRDTISNSDYQQITGRAGRLGMYDEGFAFLPHPGEVFAEPDMGIDPKEGFVRFINAGPNRVDSRIEMNSRFVLHLLNRLDIEHVKSFLSRSFKAYQSKGDTKDIAERFKEQRRFLQSKGYLDEHWKPTYLGKLTLNIFNEYDLLLADAFYNNTFEGLKPSELAGLMTIFIARDRKSENGISLNGIGNNDIREKAFALRDKGLTLDLPVDTMDGGYYNIVKQWAEGGDWVENIMKNPVYEPGDVLDIIRRTANLLRQIADSKLLPPELRDTAREASEQLLRDEVLQQVTPSPVDEDGAKQPAAA